MGIQLFKPTFHIDECLEEIRECLEEGWTGLGFKTIKFENRWNEYTGHKNSHYLNSASAGLHLAIKILKLENKWNDGDEIISTPLTFVSTNHAIMYENLVPRFADIDEYLCLDPKDVKNKINDKTRAIVFVGYGGRVGRLKEIIKICKEYNLKLILDAAHMAGTRMDGIFPGTLDGVDVAIYSYQAVKNLPTADSGMICFNNEKLDSMCRKFTWLGINKDTYTRSNSEGKYKWEYDVEYLGFKNHGNSIMAAIALVQLKYLDSDNEYRRELCKYYDELFANNSYVKSIPAPFEKECSYHIYAIEVDDRDNLMMALNDVGIFPGVHYKDNTEYDMYSYDYGKCPNAHKMSKRIISLPLHMQLNKEEIRYIAQEINKFTGCK
ncbi:DegT/DnrJ/EryC1/StrS family aminotransferase [Clostridioides difficile]|nr:DegT/DnrJ/EryC1/StrS family aminotransferase [Clostridioides difficile]